MPCSSIEISRNVVARFVDVIFPVGIGQVHFDYQSVIIAICYLPSGLFSKGLNISKAANVSGPAAGKGWSLCFFFNGYLTLAHEWQSFTDLCTSFEI